MRTIFLLAFLMCTLASVHAQSPSGWSWGPGIKGEGPVSTKKLKLESFTSIALAISGNVYLYQGEQQKVEVEGQENIIENLKTVVENGTWKIQFKQNVRSYEKLNIYITLPTVREIVVSGSGDVVGKTRFEGLREPRFAISGSGSILLDIQADEVETQISGSGDIELSGSAEELEAAISGSGDVAAEKLKAKSVEVSISGSGDAFVSASDLLKVSISGSGDVAYLGKPKTQVRISGSGDVISKE